jgi:protein tyrosine/serine phosphatase
VNFWLILDPFDLAVIVSLMAVLSGSTVLLWKKVIRDRLIPKRWAVVKKHRIYRSGRIAARLMRRTLAGHKIKVIVDLTGDNPRNPSQTAEKSAAAQLGIKLHRFTLRGSGTGDVNLYAEAVAAVIQAEKQGQPVLIHCAAGVQRTGGVIAFYRLLVDKNPPEVVMDELIKNGFNPKRNHKLIPYINKNLSRIAMILHEKGLIEQVPRLTPLCAE